MKTRPRLAQLALAIMVLVSSTACATVGRSFNHTNVLILEIGALKSDAYQRVFGKPWNVQTSTNSDGKFEDIRFLYARGDIATSTARVLDLESRDGVLNAWIYISGFDEDRTVVDLALTDKIQKGIHRQNEVQALLGKPHGKAVCPSLLVDYKDRCKGVEIWAWGALNKLVTMGRNPSETAMISLFSTVTELSRKLIRYSEQARDDDDRLGTSRPSGVELRAERGVGLTRRCPCAGRI